MPDTQAPDIVELQPCPFCNQHLRVVPSLTLAFDPPRPLVEYHHHGDEACIIRRAMWAFYDDELEKFATFAAKWNNRLSNISEKP